MYPVPFPIFNVITEWMGIANCKRLNISDLCDKYSIAHEQIDILKLDIEGAEISTAFYVR